MRAGTLIMLFGGLLLFAARMLGGPLKDADAWRARLVPAEEHEMPQPWPCA